MNQEIIKRITDIHRVIKYDDIDAIKTYAIMYTDYEDIGEALLEDNILPQGIMVEYQELLRYFIEFCSFIENETPIKSIITDELYDKLVEKLINIGGGHYIGSPTSNIVGIEDRPHYFPELRGSLPKIHFIKEDEIPKKDSRKSLEGFLRGIVRQLKDAGKPVGLVTIHVGLKYDGVSHIIDVMDNEVNLILTRGNVTNNLGKNLTPVFSKLFPKITADGVINGVNFTDLKSFMRLEMLPEDLKKCKRYGIKVETYMPGNKFDVFKDAYSDICNHRSAVTSICNQSVDSVDSKYAQYLRMQHLQLATDKQLELNGIENMRWYPIGKINNHYQYLFIEGSDPVEVDLNDDIDSACRILEIKINKSVKDCAETNRIPIDGAVITIMDETVINLLGRKNDKNMFQVAFKFPAGEARTTIENIEFQVGPVSGFITPVAKIKPVVINGTTITSPGLSNREKLERLNLHKGDEVIIKHDIVPKLFKDSTCKESDGELFIFPEECPICNAPIVNDCCSNPDCPAKVVGHITNFINKNNVKGGLGIETVITFVNHGFLNNIADLYRLVQHKKELENIPGFGEASVEQILSGIRDITKLHPHEIFGAIGIPNIGMKTAEKICRNIDMIGNLGNLEDLYPKLIKIPMIGESIAMNFLEGVERKIPEIEDICKYVEILPYEKEVEINMKVCFSDVRDKDFEKYLTSIGIGTTSSMSKKVAYLIVPDEPVTNTTKMNDAKKLGVEMIKISDAKRKWGFNK